MPGTSPLTHRIRRTLAAHAQAERTGIPVDEVLGMADAAREERRASGPTRRAVLGGALGAAGAVALGSSPAAALRPTAKPTTPSVAIVGAGLAGIRAAHWLWTVKGIRSTVYEGSERLGGRVWTLRDYFDHGQVVEHGGAFINTDHNAIRNLVNSLGLSLYELAGGAQPPYGDIYWANGAPYTYEEASQDWAEVYATFKAALAEAPYPQTAFSQTPAGRTLDLMSVDQWIDDNIPGGLGSRFGQIMQSNSIAEYGLDPGEQSALNLIYLLGWNGQNSLDPINGADERFGVVGGNDQIIHRMVADLPPGTVQPGHRLVAIRANGNGTARLTFRAGNRTFDTTADRAILALPFTTLRDVDYSGAGFSAQKVRAIEQLGLGANGKIHVQLTGRPWLDQQLGGVAYTPVEGFQCLWDDTVNQLGDVPGPITGRTPGILCYFPGGSATLAGWKGMDFGPAPDRDVADYLAQTEPLFPGVTAAYNGLAWRDAWHLNPWSKGAYTCPRPGQYTDHFGVPELAQGPFHFAGEHTSSEYYGFLNGAVVSGERAAKEVALA